MPQYVFPESVQEEIPVWVKLEAFQPKPNIDGNDAANFGTQAGGPYWFQAPQSLILGDSHTYNQVNFKALLGGAAMTNDLGGAFGDLISAARVAGGDLPVIGDVGTNINYLTQQTANPREEVVFSKPNFRTISLAWELGVQSQSDGSNLITMINEIRRLSYPTIADAFLYQMPSQWQLTIGSRGEGGSSTPQFFSFGKCVLENLSTNYTGAGIMALNAAGQPGFVNLEMTFKEVKLRNQGSAVFS